MYVMATAEKKKTAEKIWAKWNMMEAKGCVTSSCGSGLALQKVAGMQTTGGHAWLRFRSCGEATVFFSTDKEACFSLQDE